jgi:hypothetical protein
LINNPNIPENIQHVNDLADNWLKKTKLTEIEKNIRKEHMKALEIN